jgi:hypothetical protein
MYALLRSAGPLPWLSDQQLFGKIKEQTYRRIQFPQKTASHSIARQDRAPEAYMSLIKSLIILLLFAPFSFSNYR